jgi:hypothetical protein
MKLNCGWQADVLAIAERARSASETGSKLASLLALEKGEPTRLEQVLSTHVDIELSCSTCDQPTPELEKRHLSKAEAVKSLKAGDENKRLEFGWFLGCKETTCEFATKNPLTHSSIRREKLWQLLERVAKFHQAWFAAYPFQGHS